MEAFFLLLRLVLAGIFGVAGVAKFADLEGSRKALVDFGVPVSLSGFAALLLPTAEIVVAVSMFTIGYSWFGAIGAAALLIVFIAGMAVQMAKGNAPDCHCFGQLHSEPVSRKSVVRNIVFIAPAIALIAAGRAGQGLSITNMDPETIKIFIAVAGAAILAAILYFVRLISEQQTQIMRRIEMLELISRDGATVEREDAGSPHDGLPIGAILPEFDLADTNGKKWTTANLFADGRPSLLLFVSATCTPCGALAPKFDAWQTELKDKLNVVFISSGTVEENLAKFAANTPKTILLQDAREYAEQCYARWTPSALYVDASGRVASHVAAGDSAIEELVNKIKGADLAGEYTYFELGNSNGHSHVQIGEKVPDFAAEAIDGRRVTSLDLKGRPTLVTFWSPTCPHCLEMIDEIKEWDKAKGKDAPDLVLFSDGDEQPHRDLGLTSPIVLDKDYSIASKLGMHGTPSGVLINEDGKFASELAVGAANIWALVGRKQDKA